MAPDTAYRFLMLRNARIKLTILYTLVIALVMALFSLALYFTLSTAMASNLEVSETATPRVEQAIINAQLARARLALLAINGGGWIVAAVASYMVAGRTLRPIENALARQRQFTAHASHELRTPLTIIKGEIDVTRARARSVEQYCETLDYIDAEVAHLEAIIGDLLALARVEAGQRTDERTWCNVASVIGDLADSYIPRLQSHDVKLDLDIPSDLDARLDWPRIRHLLLNLLDNALQYTPARGEIRVQAGQQGRCLELTVFNSGSSIDPQDLPHLFLPFYRGKGSNPDTGTGLGLALCDWVVRTHQGSIAAHNRAGGVAFVVRLPRD